VSEETPEIDRVLVTEDEIRNRVSEMAKQIEHDFSRQNLVVVALLTGTVVFLADLIRHIHIPLRLDFMGVSSYRGGTDSRELRFTKELVIDISGCDVLLVDDILDTGKTLNAVLEKLQGLKPRQIRTCVLLSKQSRRNYDIMAHYIGFEVPEEFVVGYGLDYAERHRNLPFIGVLKPEIYSP